MQVKIEPVDDVFETLDAVPGLAGTGELVGFAGEANHDGGDTFVFEGAEEFFAAGGGWGAVVGVAENEHHGRLDVVDESEGGVGFVEFDVVEGGLGHPVLVEFGDVRGVPPGGLIGDVALGGGGFEAVGLGDGPVGEEAAAGAAGDA